MKNINLTVKVHTTPASAQLIADEYFLYIIENYNDKIASIINLEN